MQPFFAARYAELNMAVRDGRYLATLRADGVPEKRRVFRSEIEVAEWATAIFFTSDRDLYVHLRAPAGACGGRRVLDPARKLELQGIMTGIADDESVCRPGIRRLQ